MHDIGLPAAMFPRVLEAPHVVVAAAAPPHVCPITAAAAGAVRRDVAPQKARPSSDTLEGFDSGGGGGVGPAACASTRTCMSPPQTSRVNTGRREEGRPQLTGRARSRTDRSSRADAARSNKTDDQLTFLYLNLNSILK